MKIIDRKKIILKATEEEIALPIILEKVKRLNKKGGLSAEDCVIESNKAITVKLYLHDENNIFGYIPHKRELVSDIYIDANEILTFGNDIDEDMMKIGSVVVNGEVGTEIKIQLTYEI